MNRLGKEGFKALYHKHGLHRLWSFLELHVKNSIRILPKKEEEGLIGIGESKFGGSPDLPKDVDWFERKETPMAFVAQLNLDEVSAFDVDNVLPSSGILFFFYDQELDCLGYHPRDEGAAKVFYYDGEISELERKNAPKGLEHYARFNSCRLHFNSVINIPQLESSSLGIDGYDLGEEERSQLSDFEDELMEDIYSKYEDQISHEKEFDTERFDYKKFKLLGHANNAEFGSHAELICELVTNGLDCEDYSIFREAKVKELEQNANLWQLLFQVDTSSETGFHWASGGILYYWIKDVDLREKKFENTWGMIQNWSH